ncbi:MAG TPA: putative PEP-binding protein, partial [Kiloniellaceae bacterium]|nr:putative PEP-binding protein [Kiloniellaceae bacterium]
DLSYRLLAGLTGKDHLALANSLTPDKILICRSLGTAELLKIGTRGLAGLVVADATPASHLAIIANSLQIPALGQAPDALTDLCEGDEVIIDAVNGQLIGRPNESVAQEFAAQIAKRRREADVDRTQRDLPAVSRCGQSLDVMANAGLLLDLDGIAPFPSLGIGLYRTEMAFLIRSELPSVSEQAALYRQVYQRMSGRPVVFRTLDVGSDKALSYLGGHAGEANPALGWRAIRMGLDRPELLSDQLRALLMAATDEILKIMFPMVTEVEEFLAARQLLQEQIAAMSTAGQAMPKAVEVGVMLEVPALLWDLDRLMEAADFVSLGTNDLFQFLNAADRNNPKTTARYSPLRSPNLRLLTQIAAAAKTHETPLGVCGELAGTPLGFIALLGCGYRSFSMNAANIAQIKQILSRLDLTLVEHCIQDLAAHQDGELDDAIAAIAADFGIDPVEAG